MPHRLAMAAAAAKTPVAEPPVVEVPVVEIVMVEVVMEAAHETEWDEAVVAVVEGAIVIGRIIKIA